MKTRTKPPLPWSTQHRRRQTANGFKDVLVYLPRETLAIITEFQARHGLKSRSDAINQLISERRSIEKPAT